MAAIKIATEPDSKPPPLSLEELRILAAQGNIEAQFTLGFALSDDGFDNGSARCWWNRDSGRVRFCLNYEKGKEVRPNYVDAATWFRTAAESGHVRAQFELGLMHLTWDKVEARRWFLKAAEAGDADAQFALGFLYERKGPKGQVEAARWYLKAAEQGIVRAQCNLGHMYLDGLGVSRNHAHAIRWFRQAADQGDMEAQFYLGECYYDGQGVVQDYGDASAWYRRAADQGSVSSQFKLGMMHYEGKLGRRDWIQAYVWISLTVSAWHKKDLVQEVAKVILQEVAKNITPAELDQALRLLAAWKPKAEGTLECET
jgi:TPR repeat protein